MEVAGTDAEPASEPPLAMGSDFAKCYIAAARKSDCPTVVMTKQAVAPTPVDQAAPDDFSKEVNDFSAHCAYTCGANR
jgi:hypothetical protein